MPEFDRTSSTMPLQKSAPQGPTTVDPQMTKHKQMQERRRTLQTISELSVTDTTPSDFRTFFANEQIRLASTAGSPENMRKPSNLNKRQSLPQYCVRPECIQTRSSPPPVPAIHIAAAQRASSGNGSQPSSSPRHEAGWNARRERARLQAEQALSGVPVRREPSNTSLQNTNTATIVSSLPRAKTSQPYLRSNHSQQHLLHNSRSSTGTSSVSGQSARHKEAWDVESSGRASTDSSSFHSSRDSTMRRSRSSSSSQSFTPQGVPPLPAGCAQPTQTYYSALTSHYHNGYPFQLPGPMYAKAPSEMRSSSLPFMRVEHAGTPLLGGQFVAAPGANKHNYGHGHKQRPKSLSARSTSSHRQTTHRTTSRASLPSQRSRHSTQNVASDTSSSQRRSHSQSRSSLKAPKPAHLSSKRSDTTSVTFDQSHRQRALPDRESLTKWKAEREGARAEFGEKMKERVRRANEMEQEKEKELQAVGKGAEKGARVLGIGLEKERVRGKARGCLGGWFGRVMGRRRS
jgi:hypothetical protein